MHGALAYDAPMANSNDARPDKAGLLQRWLRESKDQGVIVLDRHGVIVDWLAGAEQVLGYSAQEAVGRHIAMIFTHEDRAMGFPDHELGVAASDRYSEDSRWHVRRDGTRIWVTGSVSAVRDDEGGAVLGFVKVIRDVTDERTRVERLEHEIASLMAAQEENRGALRFLGHQLRNPLSTVAAAAGVLERVTSDERGRKAVALLGQQLDVLRGMAEDLSSLARPRPGEVQLELATIDLRQVLQEVADLMEPLAAEKSVRIQVVMPPSPLWVRADAARIRQVAVNLVGNAIKYNRQGGNVWMVGNVEAHEALCRVMDDGLGIFPPVLPRLFELFSHEADAEEQRQRGTGMGLVLVRQLVELHGGTVQAKSAGLGKGAEFSFRLPAVEPAQGS